MKLTTRVSRFFLIALAVILVGNSLILYGVARTYLEHHFDEQLDALLHVLVAAAEEESDDVKFEATDHYVADETSSGNAFWLIVSGDGRVIAHSENYHAATGTAPQGHSEQPLIADPEAYQQSGWRIVTHHLAAPDPKPVEERSSLEHAELTVIAASRLSPLQSTLFWLAVVLIVLPAFCWLIAALLGRRFCGQALKPIRQLADEVRQLDVRDPRARLDVPATADELEELGGAFNELLDQLFQEYEHQRRFAGNTAHQLRTPLTVMQGQVDVALRRPRSVEEYQETLSSVSSASRSLNRTVDALLFLARPAGDEPIPDLQQVDLSAWLLEELNCWQQDDRGDDLVCESESGLICETSPALLGQILEILVSNAFKYSEPGTSVTVQAKRQGNRIELAVQDQGMGIAEEDRESVFEPFFRTRQARQQASPGTGLGLALAQHIATALSLELQCESRLGEGSRFVLSIPSR